MDKKTKATGKHVESSISSVGSMGTRENPRWTELPVQAASYQDADGRVSQLKQMLNRAVVRVESDGNRSRIFSQANKGVRDLRCQDPRGKMGDGDIIHDLVQGRRAPVSSRLTRRVEPCMSYSRKAEENIAETTRAETTRAETTRADNTMAGNTMADNTMAGNTMADNTIAERTKSKKTKPKVMMTKTVEASEGVRKRDGKGGTSMVYVLGRTPGQNKSVPKGRHRGCLKELQRRKKDLVSRRTFVAPDISKSYNYYREERKYWANGDQAYGQEHVKEEDAEYDGGDDQGLGAYIAQHTSGSMWEGLGTLRFM